MPQNITIMVRRKGSKDWKDLYVDVSVPQRLNGQPEEYAAELLRKYVAKFPHSKRYGHAWDEFRVFVTIDRGEFDDEGQPQYG